MEIDATFWKFRCEIEMFESLIENLKYLIFLVLFYGLPLAFFFFLVITVAMRDRDTKLKFREIMSCAFKKLF